ncbi:unnamed protein product [[Candida] boidinii]|nr:unnamed protein product [[Candida] boidinii]
MGYIISQMVKSSDQDKRLKTGPQDHREFKEIAIRIFIITTTIITNRKMFQMTTKVKMNMKMMKIMKCKINRPLMMSQEMK